MVPYCIVSCNISMGNRTSSQITRQVGGMNWSSTAKVIHLDGRLQEFKQPIKASYILSRNPNCLLWSSETMFVGSLVPHLDDQEELQLGQLYFIIPISISQKPLSLQDLCQLAIKASTALSNSQLGYKATKTSAFSDKNGIRFLSGPPEGIGFQPALTWVE